MTDKLTDFVVNKVSTPIEFVETVIVKEGVECDIYTFVDDDSKDLAIVSVRKGYKTPLQKVRLGTKTVEGYLRGEGTLTMESIDKQPRVYKFNDGDKGSVNVKIGESMQWSANGKSDLVFYEICDPPYQEDRFETIES